MSDSETVTLPTVAPGRLELSSPISSLELTVVANDSRPVATGFGRLTADALRPGFYEIRMRAGPIIERLLVRVPAGETVRFDGLEVSFPSAAPVAGTTTTHEPHMLLAEQASRALLGSPTGTGLVLMVRDVRGPDGPPLDPVDIQSLSILDSHLQPLPETAAGWRVERTLAAATWAGHLPPGGYALRAGAEPADQSIWLAEGWQTIVFITTGDAGLRVERASVHMTHLDLPWMPQERDVGLALELALWGLREGRAVVPDDLLNLLLGAKFVNPMLGIVGAHALAMRADPAPDALGIVLGNLQSLVPGHPDVAALRRLAEARRLTSGEARGTVPAATPAVDLPVSWPPMLLESYRALIRSDARHQGAIADGSVAQEAAAHLQVRDVWTSWRPFDLAPAPSPPLPADVALEPAASARISATALAGIARDPASLSRVRSANAAETRVLHYLASVVELEGSDARERLLSMSPAEIGLGTTLPAATVDRALGRIGVAMSGSGPVKESAPRPPRDHDKTKPAPNGGGGGFRQALVVLATVVGLLLAGMGGAIALGLLDDRNGDESPPATILVTEAPTAPVVVTEAPTATIVVTEAPTVAVTPTVIIPAELRFADTEIDTSTESELPIVNEGPGAVTFTAPRIDGPASGDFANQQDSCTDTPVPEGSSCTFLLSFTPSDGGDRVATMRLETLEAGVFDVSLVGLGVDPPFLLLEPSALSFGEVPLGSQSPSMEILVSQVAGPPVEITSLSDTSDEFPFDPGDCPGLVLEPGVRCAMKIAFAPMELGERSEVLQLLTSAGGIHQVVLSGVGLEGPTPDPGPIVD